MRRRLLEATERLADYPHLGVQTDEHGIRRIVATPFPYLIFYEVASGEIVVHAIRHSSRDPSAMPG